MASTNYQSTKKNTVFFFILFGAVLLAYINSLQSEFLGDDVAQIQSVLFSYGNSFYKTLSLHRPDRPFFSFVSWLNFQFFGTNYFGYKLVSLLIHAFSSFALFKLIKLVSGKYIGYFDNKLALIIAILFAVHPATNQSINIIFQRCVLMAGGLSIVSLYFFIKFIESKNRNYYLFSLLAFLLALLSKQNVVTLPVILALFVLILHREIKFKKLALWILPYLALCVIPFIFVFLLKIDTPKDVLPWLQYLIIQTRVVFIYFRLLFFPVGLRFLYDINTDPNIFLNYTWLAISGHLVIWAFGLYNLNKRPLLAFCIFATYIALSLESSFFPINQLVQEQRTYLPYIFIFLGFSIFMIPQSENIKKWTRIFLVALGCIFIGINLSRNREINTQKKWLINTTDYSISSLLNNLATFEFYHYKNEFEEGLKLALKINQVYPNNPAYLTWLKRFEYEKLKPGDQKKALEYIANQLMSPQNLYMFNRRDSRVMLNDFVLDKLIHGEIGKNIDVHRKNILTEKLLAPQLEFFIDNYEFYEYSVRAYYSSLHFLKNYYIEKKNKNGYLSKADAGEFSRIEIILERTKKFIEKVKV
jgi:hypothetical protein